MNGVGQLISPFSLMPELRQAGRRWPKSDMEPMQRLRVGSIMSVLKGKFVPFFALARCFLDRLLAWHAGRRL